GFDTQQHTKLSQHFLRNDERCNLFISLSSHKVFAGFFVGLVAARFAQTPGKQSQQQARNTCEDEGPAPLTSTQTRYYTADNNAYHDADQGGRSPPAQYSGSPGATEIIGHECAAGGRVPGFTNPKDHA